MSSIQNNKLQEGASTGDRIAMDLHFYRPLRERTIICLIYASGDGVSECIETRGVAIISQRFSRPC